MIRFTTRGFLVGALLCTSLPLLLAQGAVPPVALSDTRADGVPSRAAQTLREIRARDTAQMAVSLEDGRFLRVITATRGTRRALEIGASRGYSAIWIGLGLRETGGQLVTIEYDAALAREATLNVAKAGLSDIVRVISGDAFAEIPRLAGGFDLVFLDAWKPDYKKFFDLVLPRLDKGGLFAAHNVVNKKNEMTDFLTAISTRSDVWSTIVSPSGEGISLSYKVR
jgi:caffeoyl-CoA O-methyltransferase